MRKDLADMVVTISQITDKYDLQILNERIEAQKKYKIQSTPTVLINEKKFNGKSNYTELKKAIEKLL